MKIQTASGIQGSKADISYSPITITGYIIVSASKFRQDNTIKRSDNEGLQNGQECILRRIQVSNATYSVKVAVLNLSFGLLMFYRFNHTA